MSNRISNTKTFIRNAQRKKDAVEFEPTVLETTSCHTGTQKRKGKNNISS